MISYIEDPVWTLTWMVMIYVCDWRESLQAVKKNMHAGIKCLSEYGQTLAVISLFVNL